MLPFAIIPSANLTAPSSEHCFPATAVIHVGNNSANTKFNNIPIHAVIHVGNNSAIIYLYTQTIEVKHLPQLHTRPASSRFQSTTPNDRKRRRRNCRTAEMQTHPSFDRKLRYFTLSKSVGVAPRGCAVSINLQGHPSRLWRPSKMRREKVVSWLLHVPLSTDACCHGSYPNYNPLLSRTRVRERAKNGENARVTGQGK